LESAAADFRFATLPASAEPDLVLLASDGYGNSFASTDWWHGLVEDLARFVDENGFDSFRGHFPDWLAESAAVGGDDVSSVVLVREPLLVEPAGRTRPEEPMPTPAPVNRPEVPAVDDAVLPPPRTLIDDDPPTTTPVRRHARTRLWLLFLDCLPRLIAGHRLPNLEADPDPALLGGGDSGGPVAPAPTSSVPTPTPDAGSDRHLSPPSAPGTKVVPDRKHPTKKQRR